MDGRRNNTRFALAARVTLMTLMLGLLFSPSPALSQQLGPVFFVDELEELTHGPPLKEFEVQVGAIGDVDKDIDVTLEVRNLISEDGEELILEVDPATHPIKAHSPSRAEIVTFKLRPREDLYEDLNTEAKTYAGVLVATRGTDESIAKRLTLTSGPEEKPSDVAVLPLKLVITAESCPWSGNLIRLCGSRFLDNPRDEEGRPTPEIRQGASIVLLGQADDYIGAEGIVVDEDGQGGLSLRLLAGYPKCDDGTGDLETAKYDVSSKTYKCEDEDAILVYQPSCWCSDGTRDTQTAKYDVSSRTQKCDNEVALLMCEYPVNLRGGRGKPTSGKFEGTFYLDASDKKEGPSVSVIVLLREHPSRPFCSLIAGIALSLLLTWYYGPVKARREAKQLAARRDSLTMGAGLFKKKLEYETVGAPVIPDLLEEIEAIAELKPIAERLNTLESLFDPFRASYEKLRRAERQYHKLKGSTQCPDEDKAVKDSLNAARELLWTADDDKTVDDAENALIKALVKLGELRACLGKGGVKGYSAPKNVRLELNIVHPIKNSNTNEGQEVDIKVTAGFDPVQADDCVLDMTWDFGEPQAEKLKMVVPLSKGVESKEISLQYHFTKYGKYTIKVSVVSQKGPVEAQETVDVEKQSVGEWLQGACDAWVVRWREKLSSPWYQHLGPALAWLVRVGIVVASGYYVVYLLEPTFGAFKHHLYAFLWGVTGSVAVKAIASVLGQKEGILSTFAGLLSK